MFVYRVVRQKLFHPELGLYCTFGLLALHVCAGQGKLLYFVQDVSVDRALVADLAARCTAEQLEPCQLHDVIEDALAGT